MGAAVVSCGDASPVLEPAEHALDAVALPVEVYVVQRIGAFRFARPGIQAVTSRTVRDCADPVAVVALVGDQPVGVRQVGQHRRRAAIIADLALGEQQDQGLAFAVADRVQLRVQAALGSTDAAGNSPFLSRLAAVRWAFRCVASIITVSVAALAWRERPARSRRIQSAKSATRGATWSWRAVRRRYRDR